MAGIDGTGIAAGQQFGAVAWLRWRLFVNGFRRKGGKGELVARIIVFPVAALFVIGPVIGAGLGGYAAVAHNGLAFLTGIFWAIFALQILVSINISPPGLSFDPESLIRYPLGFSRYVTIRLFLGLLSASTVVGTLALFGAATGATIARHDLGPVLFAAALALAVCNMLFIRMLFAWVDRWLSTRRARELFTVFLFVFSIGIQYVNASVNGMGRHTTPGARKAKLLALVKVYHHVEPYLHDLPPGLAGRAILRQTEQAPGAALALLGGVLLYAAACLAVFAWRMQKEYRGENLSEAAKLPPQPVTAKTGAVLAPTAAAVAAPERQGWVSPVVAACYEKEWIYVRRNPAQFYGLIAPLAMILIFKVPMSNLAKSGTVFPAAVAYAVLGVAVLAYNSLGLDASGVQFYFLAPVTLRSVMLGKNLFSFSIIALQVALVYLTLVFTSGAPPLAMTASTVAWVAFACLANTTVGNMRSIKAPKKIDPGKISRRQASQLSALLCIGIMLVAAGLGAGLIAVGQFARMPWLPGPILLALALGAFALYVAGLNRVDGMALDCREELVEELSKAS